MLLGISSRGNVQRDFGQRGFKLQNLLRVGTCLGIGFADQLKDVCDMLHILLAEFFICVAGAQIVIALGQTEPALIENSNLLACVLEVLQLAAIRGMRSH